MVPPTEEDLASDSMSTSLPLPFYFFPELSSMSLCLDNRKSVHLESHKVVRRVQGEREAPYRTP